MLPSEIRQRLMAHPEYQIEVWPAEYYAIYHKMFLGWPWFLTQYPVDEDPVIFTEQ
jgi:hypothetical protein